MKEVFGTGTPRGISALGDPGQFNRASGVLPERGTPDGSNVP